MKKGSYSMSTKIRIFIDFDWREWVLPMGAAVLAELWLASREKRWLHVHIHKPRKAA